jgi:hypothetical protein
MFMVLANDELPEVTVGVLLAAPDLAVDDLDAIDDADGDREPGAGHVPAWGERGRHAAPRGMRMALLGQQALVHSAEAIGREVGLVINAVVAGMQARTPSVIETSGAPEEFAVDSLELKFGVKASLSSMK